MDTHATQLTFVLVQRQGVLLLLDEGQRRRRPCPGLCGPLALLLLLFPLFVGILELLGHEAARHLAFVFEVSVCMCVHARLGVMSRCECVAFKVSGGGTANS